MIDLNSRRSAKLLFRQILACECEDEIRQLIREVAWRRNNEWWEDNQRANDNVVRGVMDIFQKGINEGDLWSEYDGSDLAENEKMYCGVMKLNNWMLKQGFTHKVKRAMENMNRSYHAHTWSQVLEAFDWYDGTHHEIWNN